MKPRPSKLTLELLYHEERQTLKQIAEHFHCSHETVRRWLRHYAIYNRVPKLPKAELERFYVTEKLSGRQIAKQTGYSWSSIVRWLRLYEIPIRRVRGKQKTTPLQMPLQHLIAQTPAASQAIKDLGIVLENTTENCLLKTMNNETLLKFRDHVRAHPHIWFAAHFVLSLTEEVIRLRERYEELQEIQSEVNNHDA